MRMTEPAIFSDTFLAFGSHCDVVLPNLEADTAKNIFQQIKADIEQLESTISRFSLLSDIHEVNQTEKDVWMEVPDELWEILTIANDFNQMSQGAFDITMFPVQSLWVEKEDVEEKDLEESLQKCGFDKIELDLDNKRLRFKEDGVELDFGAIEKGFALDLVKPLLIDLGVKDAIISFEEDVVLALGNHPAGTDWPLGIRNQQQPNEFAHVFEVSDQTVYTTGTVYIRDDGEGMKDRKIISPATGIPVEGKRTVSVKADSATMGAFIANIWLILPENDKAIISNQLRDVEILEVEYTDDDVKTKTTIIEKEDRS
ncbi:FAD:protein FMN transferase [uncultured Draconibacterium sp.]|uniref:FAD:protein FMN transferase n=1 Tax=uncultured Draconibacterium sp. TaxID=1573823 RepID=UPI0029C9007F|nr:FAD:protein FMN transferase [uncultured Draconibacterium sp.]